MSHPYPAAEPAAAPARPARTADPAMVRDLRAGAVVAVLLAVLGAPLGLLWAAWSPPGPRALVVRPGVFIPDETEAFVAGDGRFLVIAAAVGLVAGVAAWTLRPRRGLIVVLALLLGGLAGALLQELVGHLTGGGSFSGAADTIIARLPLSLHAQGLLFVEPALAVLGYGMLVAFTQDDDLGRPDPVRARLVASVDPDDHPQHGGGDGNAPGAAQQRDLPA